MPTRVEYSEGLRIGYRWFDATPSRRSSRSATDFRTRRLCSPSLVRDAARRDGHGADHRLGAGQEHGRRRGAEVPQVYLGLPSDAGEPPKRLVGFEKVWLEPGQATTVRMTIDPRATNHPLGVWDESAKQWLVRDGSYVVSVGTSSGGTFLSDTLRVRAR